MQYMGLFYTKTPMALRGLMDKTYTVLGRRHAIAADHCAEDGGAVACAVGYIRNERALAEEFRQAGLRLAPEGGPSALALAAYRLWGDRYAEHLEGPVASVIIDQDADRLLLSRDRMGEKGVFYLVRGTSVAFADHPAALLHAPFASRAVDRDGLCELFALGPARTPGRTPLMGIGSLEPGTTLIADSAGQTARRYHRLEAREHTDSLSTTIDQVRYLIEDAMAEAMTRQPDAMLSGGLDSTALTALARKAGPVTTWSVEYDEDDRHFTENAYQHERDTPFIAMAAGYLKTDHRSITLDHRSLFDGLHGAMTARGLPGMADVDSSLMLFARAISAHSQFVLSGECGDEVFGGYPWFHRAELIALDHFPWSGSLPLRASVLKRSVREKLMLHQYAAERYHEAMARQPRLIGEDAHGARLRLLHGLCMEWFMPVLQERADAMCGQSGVHVITPYCDDRLAQYVYNVPWAIKNLGGQEKGLLREATKDLLPPELLLRRKSPYPKTHHPLYTRLVCDEMRRVLDDKSSPILEVLDKESLLTLMQGGMSAADTPWYGQLMSGPQMIAYLLQVNDWLKTYHLEIAL